MEPDETQCIPSPISNLLHYPIADDVNIEDGLCKPQDPNRFLLSSIAFLQKQLIKKYENESTTTVNDDVNRKYSNLLLVESGQKSKRHKCYIRLPNMEKFDKVLRSEASLPQKILSNSQILPLPKKSKCNRLSITNLFKSRIENEGAPVTRSHSVFNLFRRSSMSTKINESNVLSPINSVTDVNPDNCPMIKDEDYAESVCSLTTISSSRTETNLPKIEEQPKSSQLNIQKYKELSDIEEEILKVIPTEKNLEIKKSITEKLRVSREGSTTSLTSYKSKSDIRFVRRSDDFLEDPQTGIKFKCMPKVNKRRKVREQQSKLSVCIEDEPESDFENYPQQRRNYPFNCTDDVKAIVSSETIDVIMNELLYQLEERNK